MTFTDSIKMSAYNLWSRKGRTLLNLIGVVISCVMLTMTLAGTRGAREGVFDIMNASGQTRQFMIFESYNTSSKVPDKELALPDGVSKARRERITEQLEKSWRSKHAERIVLDKDRMQQLRSMKPVSSIVWQRPLGCRFVWSEKKSLKAAENIPAPKPTTGSLIGIDPADEGISRRVVVGEMVSSEDQEGVMIDEMTAYNLGHRTDEQLQDLIGMRVTIRCSLGKAAPTAAAGLLGGIGAILDPETIESLQSVAKQLDRTDLTDEQKKSLRSAVKLLPSNRAQQKKKPTKPAPETDETKDVEIDAKGNRTIVRDVIIRGVIRPPEEDDNLFGFLQFTGRGSRANVYIQHRIPEDFYARKEGFRGYRNVAGSVSDTSNLRAAIDQVESIGLRTRSAIGIIEKLEREVGKVRMAVGALALLILLVAAVGICNTMIIAVLERTTEFGIMKAVGAEDRQVLTLVLLEGMITGVIGAALAIAISFGVAELVSGIARTWIEERLKGSFDQPVFRFTLLDSMIVFGIAAAMCVFASLIPAWRAARLDPVTAMKRT